MSYIMLGLGWVLKLMYTITSNYGIAIILFTIIIKLILMPLTVKQQKSMLKTQKLQPLLMEIQKKYGNDKDKLNQETMKLYQKYKINPMSGCLPMLITFLVLFGLIDVIYNPMRHILGMSNEVIAQATEILKGLGIAFSQYSPQTAICLLYTSPSPRD